MRKCRFLSAELTDRRTWSMIDLPESGGVRFQPQGEMPPMPGAAPTPGDQGKLVVSAKDKADGEITI